MRKILIPLLGFLAMAPLAAQLVFYGDYAAALTASVRENNYDTALNPDNLYGVKDLNLSHELTVKMAGGDELADLELWFSLGRYPVGAGLLAASSEDTVSGADSLTYALVAESGDSIYYFDLMRASLGWSFGDSLLVRLGRQSLLTGYGYGWNPMDFANPVKDPGDPGADLKGVDALSLQLLPRDRVNMKVYALYDRAQAETGADYADLMGGAEITFSFPSLEMKLTGFLEQDGTEGEDSRVDGAGVGFLADLAGLGLYGEGSLLSGSRVLSPDLLTRRDSLLFCFLLGAEYVFPSETSLVAEYFYNGEGYDRGEREEILRLLKTRTAGADTLFRPGYYSRHYVLVNGSQPLYGINCEAGLILLCSADSGALTVMPSLTWNGSGSFSLNGRYTGLLNPGGEESSENALAPVRHSFSMEGRFSF